MRRAHQTERSDHNISRSVFSSALLPLVTVAFAGMTYGCTAAPILPNEPNVCSEETCPEGWCQLTVNFVEDCEGQFDSAEVLIGDALEPENATVGVPFQSQGHVPFGASKPVWIRANGWQWQVELTCDDVDSDGEFTLSCNTSDSP